MGAWERGHIRWHVWWTSATHELWWHPSHWWHSWRHKRWHTPGHTHWRTAHASHGHGSSWETSAEVLLEQRIRLSFGVVGVSYTINDLLRLIGGDLLVVGLDIAQVIATVVVSFADAHTIVGEVDIAVIAKELGHVGG